MRAILTINERQLCRLTLAAENENEDQQLNSLNNSYGFYNGQYIEYNGKIYFKDREHK